MHATSSLCCGGMAQYNRKVCRPWKQAWKFARRYKEAEPLCSAAVSILEQALGPTNPNVATALMLQARNAPLPHPVSCIPKINTPLGRINTKLPPESSANTTSFWRSQRISKIVLLPASEHVRGSVCCTQRNHPRTPSLVLPSKCSNCRCILLLPQSERIQSLDAGKRGSGGWECGGGGAAGAECAGSAAAVAGPRQQGGRRRHVHPLRRPARTRQVRPWATFAAILHNITHCLRQVQLAVEGDSAFSNTS